MRKGLLFIPVFMLLLVACEEQSRVVPETDETAYNRGMRLVREDRKKEALDAFLSVIARRPQDAVESHLEAGNLYLDSEKDPIMAIYHFRAYLKRSEDPKEKQLVEGRIRLAEKAFAASLPGKPLDQDFQTLDLLKRLDDAEAENAVLRKRVAALGGQASPKPEPVRNAGSTPPKVPQGEKKPEAKPLAEVKTVSETKPQTPPQPTGRTHTVKAGDSLYSISRDVYGTTARWQDIYNANRDQLPNSKSLKVGQVLRIP